MLNHHLIPKINKLEALAHTTDDIILKSVVIEEVYKNKDLRKDKCVNDTIKCLNERNIVVFDDSFIENIISNLNDLIEKAKNNDSEIYDSEIIDLLCSQLNINITEDIMNSIFNYFELFDIKIIDYDISNEEELDEEELDEEELNEELDEEKNDIIFKRDSIRLYFDEISKYNLLTAEEEVELSRRYRNNHDMEAFQQLVNCNLRLVVSMARHFCKLGLDFEDVIQDGNLGLLTAAEKYDPELGYRFSTYATHWIRQAITRGISDKARTIRLPVHAVEQSRHIILVISILSEKLNRHPTNEEIADYINENYLANKSKITPENVALYRSYYSPESVISYNTTIQSNNEDKEDTLLDFIEDESISVEDSVMNSELIRQLNEVIDTTLNPKEADVIRRRFGIHYNEPMTLEQVGRIYGVTRERIRQIESKAIRKLRRSYKAMKSLNGFINNN